VAALAGTSTPLRRAQAAFSSGLKQQQPCQHCSAVMQPQARCAQGNGRLSSFFTMRGTGRPIAPIRNAARPMLAISRRRPTDLVQPRRLATARSSQSPSQAGNQSLGNVDELSSFCAEKACDPSQPETCGNTHCGCLRTPQGQRLAAVKVRAFPRTGKVYASYTPKTLLEWPER